MTMKPYSSKEWHRRMDKQAGQSGDECCLCGKDTAGAAGAIHVPVNHETGEFVTKAEVAALASISRTVSILTGK